MTLQAGRPVGSGSALKADPTRPPMPVMASDSTIQSRDREAFRLQRCRAAALGPQPATSADEALLFQLAAELIAFRSATAAANLMRAAEAFAKPTSVASEALRRGLIVSLPRFRERLLQQLGVSA